MDGLCTLIIKGGPCPNRGSVRFLNLTIHYVNGEKFGTG